MRETGIKLLGLGFNRRSRNIHGFLCAFASWRDAMILEFFEQFRAQIDTDMTENEIGKEVVDAAIAVHRELGPGLMETVYEVILAHELKKRRLQVERQVRIPIEYRGMKFDEGFRADLNLNDCVLLELKSVVKLTATHRKQIQTYLRLTGMKLGFLLNFGEALMKNGIVRAVNGLKET